ncbi:MAG: carbon-nitrogen hydrolase family protein [Cephaloticoccus sp.]|nr:carbon-nitrogen hydrolase family protein [Cephaloticoccus sp.]MCF7760618.1 carbon-nitrogen hydrolase family protein [Cephaloticoccus sp.]
MGNTLRLGCAQFTARNGDTAANLATIARLAASAAKDGVQLLVLPELAVTGYARPEIVAAAAKPIPGPAFDALSAIAIGHGIALAAGLVESDPASGTVHNSMVLIASDGSERLRYRKVHLWDNEKAWATPGNIFPVAQYGGFPLGMWICYDNRFPEAARTLAKNGAHLALVAAAWLGPAAEWELSLRARAMDNGIYVGGSVHLGPNFNGVAMISDPHGNLIAQGEPGVDQVVTADLEHAQIESFHARIPLLKHLRPDSYR